MTATATANPFGACLHERIKGSRLSQIAMRTEAAKYLRAADTAGDLDLLEHNLLEALRAVSTAKVAAANEAALTQGLTITDREIEVMTARARRKRDAATLELRAKAFNTNRPRVGRAKLEAK